MTEGTTGSTVPRRQLGRYLRDLRNRARLTVRAAARQLEWSEPKIWRIETGQTSLRSLDVEAMCRTYGADAELTEALMGLAKETKARGWWHSYGDVIPETFDLYIGLEEAASHITWYESELVPGLLQTPAYARALIEADNQGVPDEEITRRAHVRMERQAILTRATRAPELEVVLGEAILRRPIGSRAIMGAQLDHLAEVADLENVSLRVIPYSAGLHHGLMTRPFVMLRFPLTPDGKETEPPTIYVESFTGALYLEKSAEVERYNAAFSNIWSATLDEAASKDCIVQAAKELRK
jgi:transcriptional regulator with XRE-family HTH domain